jgi:CubicO group peptidase (beta-lactamase class C family)
MTVERSLVALALPVGHGAIHRPTVRSPLIQNALAAAAASDDCSPMRTQYPAGRRFLLAAALLAMNAAAHAQIPDDLRGVLEPIRAKAAVPALAAVVLRGDQIVAQGAVGVRAAGSPPAVTINDRFHLGSDTKAMTATLLAMLVEEGKLGWDTTVGEVFAGKVDIIDAAWKPVTLEQLLTHRAGAPAGLDAGGLWGRLWQRKGTPMAQRLELVRGVLAHAPVSPPGSAYLYSNAGYAIAGAMEEAVTDRPWEELMAGRLFAPLGITAAGFGAPGTPGELDQPLGHDGHGQPVPAGPNADNPPAIGPAGTVNMSLPDWAKFIALHLRGDAANPHFTPHLLKAESFAHLHRPAEGSGERYAAGWLVARRGWAKGVPPHADGLVLTHAGSNTMWFCVTWLAPERDFAVLIACNRADPAAQRACDEVAGALIQKFNAAP